MATCTRDTVADGENAEVTVPPLPLSGGPTQIGSDPARTEPAEGPAVTVTGFRADTAAAAICAVAVCAAGHDAGGRRQGRIGGIFTARPCTVCTGTGLPAFDAGAGPQPAETSRNPVIKAATRASTEPTAARSRQREKRSRPGALPVIAVTIQHTIGTYVQLTIVTAKGGLSVYSQCTERAIRPDIAWPAAVTYAAAMDTAGRAS